MTTNGWKATWILLGGPIKHWWDENWDTPEHWWYVEWRTRIEQALIAEGYLIYRPYEGFKGMWDERAQAVNDTALRNCDLMLDMTPAGIPSLGTDAEREYARNFGTPVLPAPPTDNFDDGIRDLLERIRDLNLARDAVMQEPVRASLVVGLEWMSVALPPVLDFYEGQVLRLHFQDRVHKVQVLDAAKVHLPAQREGNLVAETLEGAPLETSIERILKIEVLDRLATAA